VHVPVSSGDPSRSQTPQYCSTDKSSWPICRPSCRAQPQPSDAAYGEKPGRATRRESSPIVRRYSLTIRTPTVCYQSGAAIIKPPRNGNHARPTVIRSTAFPAGLLPGQPRAKERRPICGVVYKDVEATMLAFTRSTSAGLQPCRPLIPARGDTVGLQRSWTGRPVSLTSAP